MQNVAADEYQTAINGYLGVTSENAQSYAAAITAKINDYKDGQKTQYTVTFSGYSGDSYTVSAVNDYGKQFTDPNHTGTLQLPGQAAIPSMSGRRTGWSPARSQSAEQ